MAPARNARSSERGLFGSAAVGMAAGLALAAGLLAGRKVTAMAGVGHGHPLKHRMLDAAAGVMQRKYPLEALSTYLNGFHFYADDMSRQVEATPCPVA